MGLFGKKTKPKQGAVKTVNGIHYAYRGGKWVKMSAQAQANINRNDALNRANVGGTTQLLKNQKAPSNQSSSSATTNTNNKSKTTPKKGPVVKSVGTVDFNINKDHSGTSAGLTSYNKALKASKGLKTDKERDKSTNKVLKEERDSNRNKISANKKKKRMHPIEKRNRAIHGDTEVQNLKDRHAAWKKARKEGTLADWEKTYHPNRTPQYRNRKKSSSESNKGSSTSTSNKGSTNRTKLQGKSAYDTKLDLKLTDSKVYGNKNKKKKKNLTKDEIKYPTRGTFRGS